MGKIAEWAAAEAAERAKDDEERGVTRTVYGIMRVTGGNHPELVDYKCETCGYIQPDVYFAGKAAVTSEIDCTCGNKATKVQLRTNFIHPTLSTLYTGLQPALGYDPQYRIDSYGDKKRVMRELDLIESNDSSGGNKSHSDELRHEKYKQEREVQNAPPSEWVGGNFTE